MESLANQAANPVACRGFGIALNSNLKYRIKAVQAMSQGRLPVVPSSDPKDPLNLSFNALHALSIGLKETHTAETFDLAFSLLPAVTFWISLYCERIIMPSRSHEFERDFHRISVEVLSLLLSHHHFIDALSSDTNLLTKYAPFLWLNPPSGKWFTSESQYEHIRSTVSTLGHVLPRPTSQTLEWQSRLVSRLEENNPKLIGLCFEGAAGTFARFHEKKNRVYHYNTLWGVATVIYSMSDASSSTHKALLQSNSLRLVCQVLEFLTKCQQFTDAEFKIAMTGLISVASYFTWVMQRGHSYIYNLLGYRLMPSLLKATKHLQRFRGSSDCYIKHAVAETEKYVMDVLHIMTSRLAYASILKRCRKAIVHTERMGLIEYLNSSDDVEESLRTAWIDFRNIVLHRTNILLKYKYTVCGNEKVSH